jgi:gliding motility-associated-like protein
MKNSFSSLLVFLLLFSCFAAIKAQTLTFVNAPGSPNPAAANPEGIQTADFNHDGIPDLAVGHGYATQLEIWLGVGNGAFINAPGSPIVSSVSGPNSIAIGDYNADGIPDLAVANYTGANLSIYLGAGNGSFSPAPGSPIAVGGNPYYIVTVDVNADGKLDLIEVNQASNNAYVFLGNGNGTFTVAPGSPFFTSSSPYCVVTTDFNGDSKPDIVIVNGGSNDISILLGNGNGTFTPSPGSPVSVGSFPRLAAVRDYNGDGKMDIAVTNPLSNSINILLGDGAGSFSNAPGSPMAVAPYPYTVDPADFNNDGILDLAVTSAVNSTVSVYYGSGTGSFTQAPGSPFATGNDPQSMILGDFNSDGKVDIATCNYASSDVTVLINTLASSAPNSTFVLSTGSSICLGQLASFTNTSTGGPSSFTWNFGDGGTSTSMNCTHLFSGPGTYTVSLLVSNANGSSSSQQPITVISPPNVILTAGSSICQGSSTLLNATGAAVYSWWPSIGLAATTGSAVSASPNTTTTYTVAGTSSAGCKDTTHITLTVFPLPVLTVSPSDSICSGASANLGASGASTYSWSPSATLNTSTGDSVISTTSSAITYTVTGTDTHGCKQSATTGVIVLQNPAIHVAGADTVCIGSMIPLIASGASSYSWSPSLFLNMTTGSSVTTTPLSAITYTITGLSSKGCVGTDTFHLSIVAAASASFSYDQSCSGQIFFAQQSSNAFQSSWQFGDGETSGLLSPVHLFSNSGDYAVSLIINKGTTCSDSVTKTISYQVPGSRLNIPNVFTPNGDAINDVLSITGLDFCGSFSLTIFDRWGRTLFETSSPESEFWDGKETGGAMVTAGTYFYLLSGESHSWRGFITLNR